MKKLVISMVSASLLAVGLFSSAFAGMNIWSSSPLTDSSFTGKILGVSYHNLSKLNPNEKPNVTVKILNDKGNHNIIEITFTNEDLAYATSLSTAIGTYVYVLSDPQTKEVTQFTINLEQNQWWPSAHAAQNKIEK